MRGQSERGPEDNGANDAVERKFHDTLEEVFALKQILQEFLNEPAPRAAPSTSANLLSTTGGQPPLSSRYESRRPVLDESLPPQESSPERPQVRASRKSERLLRQSVHFEPNFQARLRYYMMKNQFNKEQIQAEADEKLHEELKPTPAINQRSKRIHRSVQHLHAWGHEKELKLEQLRQAEERRQEEQVTRAPKVCRASQRISQNRVDDLAQCKVEDRLHLLGLIYEYQQEERMIEARKRRVRTRNVKVHERLHELSKRHQQASECDAPQQHSPNVKKPKETVEAAIQRLAEIGDLYRSKREDMAKKREQELAEMQRSEKLSAKSRALAEKVRSKAAHPQPTHHRKCPYCRHPEGDTPEVQPISSAQAAAIYERQIQWQALKERKCEAERQRREAEQDAEFEFRNPHYRSAWDPLRGPEPSDSECDDEDATKDASSPGRTQQRRQRQTNRSFFEKSTKWASAREQQLTHERKVWEEIHLRDCTFKPKLCVTPPRRAAERREAAARTPRSLAQGGLSRADLRTPMLGTEATDVSSDDCVDAGDDSEDPSEHGDSSDSEGASRVAYFDQGERVW